MALRHVPAEYPRGTRGVAPTRPRTMMLDSASRLHLTHEQRVRQVLARDALDVHRSQAPHEQRRAVRAERALAESRRVAVRES